jgi:ankyrin repeat protein
MRLILKQSMLLSVTAVFGCLFAGARLSAQGSDLVTAAGAGDLARVRTLLEAKTDVNAKNDAQYTALMLASKNGRTEVVKLLLDAKADVNARGRNDLNALLAACDGGHIDIVKLLLAARADVNAGKLRLFRADSGGNIAVVIGFTPLMVASEEGHTDAVKLLLEAKANVNAKMTLSDGTSVEPLIKGFKDTAIKQASAKGHSEIVALLKAAGARE